MPKAKAKIIKEPPTAATVSGSGSLDETSSTVNSTTNMSENQEMMEFADDDKGRHFWYVVYPTEQYYHEHYPDGEYDGADGWGEAPEDWIERLRATGLAFQVSELHYLDRNPSGRAKKPHWHVIVSWGNTTTYRSARGLCDLLKCPRPQLLHNVIGPYRYHRHLDNPEKHQYATYGEYYNGWEPPLTTNEVTRIKREIKDIILIEDVQEYAELLIVCESKGQEYFDVAVNNTMYCERICASYRHNPIRVLIRYFNELNEGDVKDMIGARIDELTGRINDESSSSKSSHKRS